MPSRVLALVRALAVVCAGRRPVLVAVAPAVAALSAHAAYAAPIAAGVEAPRFRLPELARPDDGLVGLDRFLSEGASSSPRKVLLLFAASYCAPCLAELAALPKLAPGWRGLGVEPVVVVIDTEDDAIAAMRGRLAPTGVVALLDRRTIVARRYGANELPLAVLIGADGRVAWTSTGGGAEALDAKVRGR